ncbi:hypothetical protein I5E97_12790 [Proteus hauseri]|uniref:hypothetical protein n=1 Tax=Proteus cibi TaxID=2050966 RepID=UPI000D6910CE|nr:MULTISPECIES: hypothetical protein [Proteus]MBG6031907.1 hypothetical protein [Proteus hauseri]
MSDNNIIKIDLEQPAYSNGLENIAFLQRDAKLKLWDRLKGFKDKAINNKTNDDSSYGKNISNNTVFISGRRGAGKTTFLKTILSDIESDFFSGKKELNIKTLVGAYFDPTSIDTNQHILIDIITSIKNSLFNSAYINNKEKNIEKINKALFKMSKGLQLLNTKKNSDFSDPSWFLDSALNSSESGLKLVDYLNEFIDEICSQFGFELILVAIDDVDTNSNKAYEMLELIRNYFNHPKFVVIISGDLELYSHIVLKKKYEELFIKDYKTNDEESEKFKNLCNNIEQQYLAKIFPLENRINLKQFDEIVKTHEIRLITKDKDEILYKEYIKNKLSKLLNTESENLGLYIQFIEQQALRTILQILKYFDLYNDKHSLVLNTPNIIKDCFLGLLFRANIDIDGLISNNTHFNMIAYELFKILEKHQELETGFYLRPGSNNETYNAAMFLFSAVVQRYLDDNNNKNRIAKSINFMLTSGASSTIYASLVSDNLKSGYSYKEYLDYIGLNKRDNILSFASHLSPMFFSSNSKGKMNKGGVIRIPRRKDKKYSNINKLISHLYCEKEIDFNGDLMTLETLSSKLSLLKIDDFKLYVAYYSILSSSHSLLTKTTGRDYCSIYCLLAAISELLLVNDNKDRIYSKLTSLQNFTAPHFLHSEAVNENKETIEDDSSSNNDESNIKIENDCHKLFDEVIKQWVENIAQINLSPILQGKVWVRIFYTINRISESLNEGKNSGKFLLGEAFSLFCYGVINSCLIEEVRYLNLPIDSEKNKVDKEVLNLLRAKLVTANNIVTSRREFYSNYSVVIDAMSEVYSKNKIEVKLSEIIPFTYSLSQCPLIKIFFEHSQDDKKYEESFKRKLNKLKSENKIILNEDLLESFDDYLKRVINQDEYEKISKNVNILGKISLIPIMVTN